MDPQSALQHNTVDAPLSRVNPQSTDPQAAIPPTTVAATPSRVDPLSANTLPGLDSPTIHQNPSITTKDTNSTLKPPRARTGTRARVGKVSKPAKKKTVHFMEPESTTYAEATANAGQRRRKAKKNATAIKAAKEEARAKLAATVNRARQAALRIKQNKADAIAISKLNKPTQHLPRRTAKHKHNTRYKTTAEVKINADFANLMTAINQHDTNFINLMTATSAHRCRPPTSTPETWKHSNLPAAAFWTANAVVDPETGLALEYDSLVLGPDGLEWIQAAANEIGRLAQGVKPNMQSGSNTIHFISHDEKPRDRKATYLRVVSSERPHKAEKKRIRFTVGGDRIEYKGKVATPTAELAAVKLLANSVISTPGAKFMTADIKDFYLGTPMNRYEYMRIPLKNIPACIMEQYNLAPLVKNGHVMVEIRKGMYGLPQAGILANNQLVKHLAKHDYHPVKLTPGIFRHKHRPVTFSLVVDDFGIKYVGKENADHLLNALQEKYTITTDEEGKLYLGITFKWDCVNKHVTLSMPGYIKKALERFQHTAPTRPQYSPHACAKIQYGVKMQLTPPPDESDPMTAAEKTRLQELIGVLLYYGRAIDNTLLVALGTLSSAQTKGTKQTAKAMVQLLDYCATNPNAMIRYHASDMCLHVHSDASYLSESEARSRAGDFSTSAISQKI